MGLKKIIAYLSCDRCDRDFEATIPNDAHHEDGMTVHEIVTDYLDFVEMPTDSKNSRTVEEAGYHDGEIYCPACWAPKSEELFIEEIRTGVTTRQQLEDSDLMEDYGKYLPVEALPAPETV